MRCDGLVAATPAGSTGYNLANQGPILAWGVEGYVVSFIAPHTLTARPLVVAPDDVLQRAQRGGPRAGRPGRRRRARGRPAERRGDRDRASATTSAGWRSSRARTSTSGSARSSAPWRAEPPGAAAALAGPLGPTRRRRSGNRGTGSPRCRRPRSSGRCSRGGCTAPRGGGSVPRCRGTPPPGGSPRLSHDPRRGLAGLRPPPQPPAEEPQADVGVLLDDVEAWARRFTRAGSNTSRLWSGSPTISPRSIAAAATPLARPHLPKAVAVRTRGDHGESLPIIGRPSGLIRSCADQRYSISTGPKRSSAHAARRGYGVGSLALADLVALAADDQPAPAVARKAWSGSSGWRRRSRGTCRAVRFPRGRRPHTTLRSQAGEEEAAVEQRHLRGDHHVLGGQRGAVLEPQPARTAVRDRADAAALVDARAGALRSRRQAAGEGRRVQAELVGEADGGSDRERQIGRVRELDLEPGVRGRLPFRLDRRHALGILGVEEVRERSIRARTRSRARRPGAGPGSSPSRLAWAYATAASHPTFRVIRE